MEDLRKVEYSSYNTVNGPKYTKPKPGFFHRWADEIEYHDEKDFAVTYGIVEDAESGQVYKVIVDQIRFV
ncbi:hypothetical protein [Sediminibacterium sp.]|uniref:hypothetical protein n=1 Tax=Sediminibacterium sp. TaxID=1917865 RepID=UPI0027313E67|nr:hypothetical protein [Sediminibacterium sp.]MDP2420092.1 hypothetical protein [Sediminibacterium sp.]